MSFIKHAMMLSKKAKGMFEGGEVEENEIDLNTDTDLDVLEDEELGPEEIVPEAELSKNDFLKHWNVYKAMRS
jgi:hypothetical protein